MKAIRVDGHVVHCKRGEYHIDALERHMNDHNLTDAAVDQILENGRLEFGRVVLPGREFRADDVKGEVYKTVQAIRLLTE
jgi:hypothetical protein